MTGLQLLRWSGVEAYVTLMVDTLRITLAQLNQSVGDLAANVAAMLAVRERARDADLIVFPELDRKSVV